MSTSMTLDEACDVIVDCEHNTAPLDENGDYFAVGTPAMRGNSIDYSEARRISHTTFLEWTRRLTPQVGDVLLAREAPVGPIVLIPSLTVAPGQRTMLLRPNPTIVDSAYLRYLLISPTQQARLLQRSEGSTVSHLNVAEVKAFKLPCLPPVNAQRAIAATLGALDDKIDSNRRIIQQIPSLIRAHILRALQAEYLDVAVADIAEFINGGAFTNGATGYGRVVIRIAELNSGIGGSTVYNDLDVPDDQIARAGDILMSWSGSLGVYRWAGDEAIINQHIFKVIPKPGYPSWLIFDRLSEVMPVFQGIARDKATTMGHIQRGHLENTHVRIPGDTSIRLLDVALASLWRRLLLAEQENRSLIALRDTLLPELLSGRLRVA